MDFGNVVLEHRPIVICQCKIDMCAICNVPKNAHASLEDCLNCDKLSREHFGDENHEFEPVVDHNYYQRSKVWGPRVVIDQISKRGKCNDCGKEYIVEIRESTFVDNKEELDRILEETNATVN